MNAKKQRIYLTGVGGQGTLTATTLLARTALEQGLQVTSGEIHGMAQRGGVVESTVLVGGWLSPTITWGEADVILGFEPMETMRGLPYLHKGGVVFSTTDPVPSPGVSAGKEAYPTMERIHSVTQESSSQCWFLPCRAIGIASGSIQCGNTALLAAFCASGLAPFGLDALKEGICKFMPAKLVDSNLKAADLGAAELRQ